MGGSGREWAEMGVACVFSTKMWGEVFFLSDEVHSWARKKTWTCGREFQLKVKKLNFRAKSWKTWITQFLLNLIWILQFRDFFCYIIHTFYVFWASGGLILSERNLLTSSKHIRYVQLSSPEYIEEVKKVKLQF